MSNTAKKPRDDGKVTPNGAAIKKHRKQLGLSRERLSFKSGVALKTIRNLETNPRHRCQPVTINVLAQLFELPPSKLIQNTDNKPALKLLTTAQEIIAANINIVTSARRILACIGSRSRDESYLREIENALKTRPELIHYRVLSLPPFKKVFQDHLLKLLNIRNPANRSQGYKTTHIGIFDNLTKQPETLLCANESSVLIVLPSMQGINEYNTALLIEDADTTQKFLHLTKSLYHGSINLETSDAILKMGLVKNGEFYE